MTFFANVYLTQNLGKIVEVSGSYPHAGGPACGYASFRGVSREGTAAVLPVVEAVYQQERLTHSNPLSPATSSAQEQE